MSGDLSLSGRLFHTRAP